MTTIDESRVTAQLNVRLTRPAIRALRMISRLTGEDYAPIVRRLLIAEHERLLAERGPAIEQEVPA